LRRAKAGRPGRVRGRSGEDVHAETDNGRVAAVDASSEFTPVRGWGRCGVPGRPVPCGHGRPVSAVCRSGRGAPGRNLRRAAPWSALDVSHPGRCEHRSSRGACVCAIPRLGKPRRDMEQSGGDQCVCVRHGLGRWTCRVGMEAAGHAGTRGTGTNGPKLSIFVWPRHGGFGGCRSGLDRV